MSRRRMLAKHVAQEELWGRSGVVAPAAHPYPLEDELGQMNPMAGERFGPYEILGTLGRGGVGEVYRAWDGRLEREVALKVLHEEYPQHGNRERFLIEARAASALSHANICTVFDMGERDGAPYLVMELLKGETLKRRIERSGLPAEEIAQFGIEIAEALGAAHALGIVHRDIKPANVMLVRQSDGRFRVKVLDFGLAKLTGPLPGRLSHHDEHLTVVGEAVGTVSYMSPEQARGEDLDGRSDLFSLGVVLYEMATRRTPFHGSTTALLFVQLLNHHPEPIHEWNDSVPRALEKVILRLLAKHPAHRFQSAAEAAAALGSAAAKASGSRWRRAMHPAVPLVRVEEPVARAVLPQRPDFRREHGVIRLGLGQIEPPPISSHASAAWTPGPVSGAAHPPAAHPDSIRPAEFAAASPLARLILPPSTPDRQVSTRAVHAGPVRLPNDNPASHPIPVETPIGGLAAAVDAAADAAVSDPPTQGRQSPTWAGGHFLRIPAATGPEYAPAADTSSRLRTRLTAAAAGVVLLGASYAAARWLTRPVVLLSPSDALLITEIDNHTGVQTFDGSLAAGLELALAQTPMFSVHGVEEYRAAVHAMGADARPASPLQARQAAQAAHARAYLYGEIREAEAGARGNGEGYTLSLTVSDAASGRELARAEANAVRTEEIPGAIDAAAASLRRQILGKRIAADPANAAIPLAREATGSLNALRAYALGARAEAEGRPRAAFDAYTKAAAADPSFVQSLTRLSWIALRQDAAGVSSQAAARAEQATEGRSRRTALLAETAFHLNAEGDLPHAEETARRLLEARPYDPAAALALARVLRREGRAEDALAQARRGLSLSDDDGELYAEAERSLIALDRYDEALATEDTAAAVGQQHPELALAAAYLAGNEPRLAAEIRTSVEAAAQNAAIPAVRAALLDNTGQLTDGSGLWRQAAQVLRNQPGLSVAGNSVLGHAALDAALAGACGSALPLARAAPSFPSNLAIALCGANGFSGGGAPVAGQSAQLRAAVALTHGDPDTALREIADLSSADPLVLYLRGVAHLAAHDPTSATEDLRELLSHRGAAFLTGTDVYPVAQAALARALAAAGDTASSRKAYGRFLTLWDGAGSADHLRATAQAGMRGIVSSEPIVAPAAEAWTPVDSIPEPPRSRPVAALAARVEPRLPQPTGLRAWPDRPASPSVGANDRRYQSVRENDLE